ncbi:Mobile element protein [Microcystis panniformis FACHB-1757]|uniref:Mobile element protein n=1 Tax=Microcystis panniformis FACHB-1757 TaxID=1638788 RepID=A0A0K1S8Q0_9CHRO|nr:Mobile element protein [Microcystis panniformis FACHB-1757]
MGEDSVLGFHLVGILAFSLSTQIFFFLATLVLSGFDPLVSVSQERCKKNILIKQKIYGSSGFRVLIFVMN